MPNDQNPQSGQCIQRVLVISEDSHLSLALGVVFSEHGIAVRCADDPSEAVEAIRSFRPDAMVTASATTVFLSRRGSEEIIDLARPVNTLELLRLLESLPGK